MGTSLNEMVRQSPIEAIERQGNVRNSKLFSRTPTRRIGSDANPLPSKDPKTKEAD
jgi:hypothetical protein